jgi:hypothetical protein
MLRKTALFLSVIFHPLLMPTYGCLLLFFCIKGTVFDYMTPADNKWRISAIILVFSFLFPLLNIYILYKLKRIPTLMLSEQKHRTFPYLMTSLFYFGIFYLLKDLTIWPEIKLFIVGAGIAIMATALINFRSKISAHMVGLGGLLGVFVAISWQIRFDMTIWFVIIILVTGLVGASRLILEEHKPSQIYMGFFTGLLIQLSMFMMVQEI